jgi:acetylornithine deacetylase/succinyl-diaminopimelate desuccinylase-like protein
MMSVKGRRVVHATNTWDGAALAAGVGRFVRIPSVNPDQAGPRAGRPGEAAMAAELAAVARRLGGEVTLDEVLPGRPNVYARFAGTEDRVVGVDVHLDTVGVEHADDDPFDPVVRHGRLHGRGAVDTKATLGVVLAVVERLRRPDGRLPGPTLYLVGTVGEEAGGLPGADRLEAWAGAQGIRFDELVVAEPTGCTPVHGHKGGLGLEITIHGRAAHSSKPELGADAVVAAARVVLALEGEHRRLAATGAGTAMGPGTVTTTLVRGGRATNIVADECWLYAGRRLAPGEDPQAERARLEDLVRRAAAPLAVDIALANGTARAAFHQPPDSPLALRLAALTGTRPETATFGSNALAYREVADQVVVFGPGSIDQAHQADEWVALSELERAAAAYEGWLGGQAGR